jgi:uncharacterized protein YaaR (DUF327 family)
LKVLGGEKLRISSSKQRKVSLKTDLPKGGRANRIAEVSFNEILTNEKSKAFDFEEQIQLVDEAANLLLSDPSQANLERYTQTVKAFLQEAIKRAYIISEQRRFDRHGVQRMSICLEIVDEKLQNLIKDFLSQNKKALNLAVRLDEIRGLLFDLYR